MNLLISKFESVLGKDCIAFKMLASDTRKLDGAAKAWANAREHVTQNMQAIADLQETEKTGATELGGIDSTCESVERYGFVEESRGGTLRRFHLHSR